MLKFNKITHNASLFPDKYEILVQQSGRQNEFIRKLAIFQGALEYIKKEYEGQADNCYNGDFIKESSFAGFLKYIDKPYTPKEPTYEVHLMGKIYEQLQTEAEDMDMIPLTLIPLYIIDREKSNDTIILQKENEILNNDDIKQQYQILQEDLHKNEDMLKKVIEQNGQTYTPPCENYYREKAIMTLYYYNLQAQAVNECKIGFDNSSIGLLGNWYPYNPRENGRFQSNSESIEHLFRLLNDEQREQLAERLNLFKEGEQYNYEKCLERIRNLKQDDQTEITSQLHSLI